MLASWTWQSYNRVASLAWTALGLGVGEGLPSPAFEFGDETRKNSSLMFGPHAESTRLAYLKGGTSTAFGSSAWGSRVITDRQLNKDVVKAIDMMSDYSGSRSQFLRNFLPPQPVVLYTCLPEQTLAQSD
jgi:hypothetical protein